jgi:2-iminobutanoate/2-iminopropanoate deaminase
MAAKTIVETQRAPSAIGPYSQAIKIGSLLYTSGVIPLDPESMEVVGTTIEEQTERVMESLKALLEDAGSDLDSVVKTTCFLADLESFDAFNAVYARYFGDSKPARSTVEVAALPKSSMVEIEAIALLDQP